MFSLVSNTCTGWQVYRDLNPGKNDFLIEFTSPFIGSLILEDEDFVRLSESYDYFMSLTPEFVTPSPRSWMRDTGDCRYRAGEIRDYVVMSIGGIEIHWIHEPVDRTRQLMIKYNGRLELSRGLRKIFLWSASEILNRHSDSERANLLKRFMSIENRSVFLTEREDEVFEDENHITVFIPEWKGCRQTDRDRFNALVWNHQQRSGALFKSVIERKFLSAL